MYWVEEIFNVKICLRLTINEGYLAIDREYHENNPHFQSVKLRGQLNWDLVTNMDYIHLLNSHFFQNGSTAKFVGNYIV